MAIRIRKSGEIVCAAHTLPEEGDCYLDDNIHYHLSVITEAIIASPNHKKDNLWFWNIEKSEENKFNPTFEKVEKKGVKLPD